MDSLHNRILALGAQIARDNGENQPSSEELIEKDIVLEDGKPKLRDRAHRPWGYTLGRVDKPLEEGRAYLKGVIADYFKMLEEFRKVAGYVGKHLCDRHVENVDKIMESPFGHRSHGECYDLEKKVASDWGSSYFKGFQDLEIALEKEQSWQNAAKQFASNFDNQPLDRQLEYVSAMHKNVQAKAQSADKQSVRDLWKALQAFLHNHEDLLGVYSKKYELNSVPKHIASKFSDLWTVGFSEERFNVILGDMLRSGLGVSAVHKVLSRFFQSEINKHSSLNILMDFIQSDQAELEKMSPDHRADYCMKLVNLCKESEREPLEVNRFDQAVIDFAGVRKIVLGGTLDEAIKSMLDLPFVEMSGEATDPLMCIQSGMALVKLVSPDMTLEAVHQLQKIGKKWNEVLPLAVSIENKRQVLEGIDELTKMIIQRPDLFELKPSETKIIQQIERGAQLTPHVEPCFQSIRPGVLDRIWGGKQPQSFKKEVVDKVEKLVKLVDDTGGEVRGDCEAFTVRALLRLGMRSLVKCNYPHIFRAGVDEQEVVGAFGGQGAFSPSSDDEDQFYSIMPTENGVVWLEDDLPGATGRSTPDISEVLHPHPQSPHFQTCASDMTEFQEYNSLPSMVPAGQNGQLVPADKSKGCMLSSGAENAMGNKDRCSFVTQDQSPTALNPALNLPYVQNGVSYDGEGLELLPSYPSIETSNCSNVGTGCLPSPPLLPNAEVNSPAGGASLEGVEPCNPGLTNGACVSVGSDTGSGGRPIHLPTTADQLNMILANENLGRFERHAQSGGGATVYTGRPRGEAESESESDNSCSDDWS